MGRRKIDLLKLQQCFDQGMTGREIAQRLGRKGEYAPEQAG
jgi:hypothetical protein